MGKELELLMGRLLADISLEYRDLLKQALYEAISTSKVTELYILYAIQSPDFKIRMDTDTPTDQLSTIALYDTNHNQIVIYKNAVYWKIAGPSDVSRVLLHEFMHAYLVILHTPSGVRQSLGERTLLARPLAFLPSVSSDTRRQIYTRLERVLVEDLQDLVGTLSFFLTDRVNFDKQYPELSSYLVQLSERYVPKTNPHILPLLQPGESCDAKYEKPLKEIKKSGQTTQMIEGHPWIAKAIYDRAPGRCGVLDHIGDTKWDTLSIKLFELYYYIVVTLLPPDGFNVAKEGYLSWYIRDHRYDYPNPPNQEQLAKMDQAATELAFGEWLAQTSEIGPFFLLLQRTMRILNKDYKAHLPKKFGKDDFKEAITLPPTIKAEFSEIAQLEYQQKTLKEIISAIYKYQEKSEKASVDVIGQADPDPQQTIQKLVEDADERQINLGAGLYGLSIAGTPFLSLGQLLLDAVSPLAIEAENDPVMGSNSASAENEGWNTGKMILATGAALVLAAGVAYSFWNSGKANSTQQPGPTEEPKSGSTRVHRRDKK